MPFSRFTFIAALRKQEGDDLEPFGKLYRDERSGHEYLVDDLLVESRQGPSFYAVYSIREIASRPDTAALNEKNMGQGFVYLTAPILVQEELIAFLMTTARAQGHAFMDRRSFTLKETARANRALARVGPG